MKLRALLIALLFAFILIPNNSAKAQFYNDAISIEPINLLFMDVVATYESKFSDKNSLAFTLNYFSWSTGGLFGYEGFTDTYIGLSATYRFYIFDWYFDKHKKHGPIEGFSFGPAVAVGYSTYSYGGWNYITNTWDSKKSIAFSIGGEAAYKWVFSENWFLEGIAKLWLTFPTDAHFTDWGGVKIGYTW